MNPPQPHRLPLGPPKRQLGTSGSDNLSPEIAVPPIHPGKNVTGSGPSKWHWRCSSRRRMSKPGARFALAMIAGLSRCRSGCALRKKRQGSRRVTSGPACHPLTRVSRCGAPGWPPRRARGDWPAERRPSSLHLGWAGAAVSITLSAAVPGLPSAPVGPETPPVPVLHPLR